MAQGQWNTWKNTSRFIVDSYHYINHKTTDDVCRHWCNPAPSDGSAPNLVGIQVDSEGREHKVCLMFNVL